jgi:hypothetical protein
MKCITFQVTAEMAKARQRNDQEKLHAFAGYIPKRHEFEYEWNNDAENAVGDMEFTTEDTKEDVELKLKVRAPRRAAAAAAGREGGREGGRARPPFPPPL